MTNLFFEYTLSKNYESNMGGLSYRIPFYMMTWKIFVKKFIEFFVNSFII
jgi:hypothetical protein